MTVNKTLIFKKVPTGLPVPGEHLVIEDRPIDLTTPPPGGVIVKLLYSSFDPYQRGRMRDPEEKSYSPPYDLDGPITNAAIARVVASDQAGIAVGDIVQVFVPIAEYAVIGGDAPGVRSRPAVTKLNNPFNLDPSVFLGVLGMPGLTAYAGLLEVGSPKAGETIFVSSAAGAVGQVVGQIAKRLGLRVIGSVGSEEKLAFIRELGFEGFNYKTESPITALPRLAPGGIDIYFENVGGDHLEAAVEALNDHGRIAVCGMISDYNRPPEERYKLGDLTRIVRKRLRIQGLLVNDAALGPAYHVEHQAKVQQWLHEGSFQSKVAVTEGIDKAAEGLVGMLEGRNFGKAVLKYEE